MRGLCLQTGLWSVSRHETLYIRMQEAGNQRRKGALMKYRGFSIVSLGLVFWLAEASSTKAQSTVGQTKLPKAVNDVLWWLPEDTQTVIVAQGPFKANAFDPEKKIDPPKLGYGSLLMATPGVELDPAILERLGNRTITVALEGSRRFRVPTHLGLMPFEGALILVYQDDLGADGKSLMDAVSKGATKTETISGIPVVMREEKYEEDLWSLYYALLKPNILIVATNRDYLKTVLNRIKQRAAKRALPANLPEWKHLDATAKTWAIRHYDHQAPDLCPFWSLIGGNELNRPDDKTVGFVFWIDPRDGGSVEICYFSNDQDAVRTAQVLGEVQRRRQDNGRSRSAWRRCHLHPRENGKRF